LHRDADAPTTQDKEPVGRFAGAKHRFPGGKFDLAEMRFEHAQFGGVEAAAKLGFRNVEQALPWFGQVEAIEQVILGPLHRGIGRVEPEALGYQFFYPGRAQHAAAGAKRANAGEEQATFAGVYANGGLLQDAQAGDVDFGGVAKIQDQVVGFGGDALGFTRELVSRAEE
jgi:hypothetical protein